MLIRKKLFIPTEAVIDRNLVSAGRRPSHRQEPHRGHGAHLQDGLPDALVGFGGQTVACQLVQIRNRPVNRLKPSLAATQVIIEAGVLVEELELLERRREELVGLGKRLAHLLRDGAHTALLRMFRPVENIVLGSLKFTSGLQHHLDNVLHPFHGGCLAVGFRRKNVHHPLGKFRDRDLRRATQTAEAARQHMRDPLNVKRHHPPIALDNRLGQFHTRRIER